MIRVINILFIGAAKRVSLLERFRNTEKLLNIKLNFFSYEINDNLPISKYATILHGLKWKDPLIEKNILNNIIDNKIDIVIPNVDPAIAIVSRIKKKYKNIYSPISNSEICDIFYNKIEANKWLIKNKFPVPSGRLIFPMIAKPRFGSASQGIVVINNKKEYANFIKVHKRQEYLIQKFITAQEFTVDGYINNKNKIIGLIPRKRLAIIGGESTLTSIDLDKDIISLSKKIVRKAQLKGPITIQYLKEINSNKSYVMDINPRFGGGVILSIEAGLNIPYYILCDYLKIKYDTQINIKNNLIMSRYFKEEFFEADN